MNLYTIAIYIYNLCKQTILIIKPRVQAITAAYVMLLSIWQSSYIHVNEVFMIRNWFNHLWQLWTYPIALNFNSLSTALFSISVLISANSLSAFLLTFNNNWIIKEQRVFSQPQEHVVDREEREALSSLLRERNWVKSLAVLWFVFARICIYSVYSSKR